MIWKEADAPILEHETQQLVLVLESAIIFHEETYPSEFADFLQRILDEYVSEQGTGIFPFPVEIIASVEEGSATGRVKVVAVIGAILTFFSNYGGIRAGIDQAAQDADKFGRALYSYVVTATQPVTKSPISANTRSGMIGRLEQLKSDLHIVNQHLDDLSQNELRKRLTLMEEAFDQVLQQAANEAERDQLGTLLTKLIDESAASPAFISADYFTDNRRDIEDFFGHLKRKSSR